MNRHDGKEGFDHGGCERRDFDGQGGPLGMIHQQKGIGNRFRYLVDPFDNFLQRLH